jgi:hypothetical protein
VGFLDGSDLNEQKKSENMYTQKQDVPRRLCSLLHSQQRKPVVADLGSQRRSDSCSQLRSPHPEKYKSTTHGLGLR